MKTTPLLIRSFIVWLLALCSWNGIQAQTYQVNGSALDQGGGLVRMTSQGIGNQTASAWSTTKIDLNQPFDRTFELFFGCDATINGGDGMTFTFHNDPRGLNAVGDGFGFLGIGGGAKLTPAVSIEFDTYDATSVGAGNEMPDDHIAVDLNGDVNQDPAHGGSGFVYFTGTNGDTTVQAIYNNRDLEDCAENSNNYYTIRIVWNPVAHTLQLYEEGTLTMTYTNDIVNTIFGGTSEVYWGFTGATGTASNEQWIAPEGSIIPWECSASTSCCAPFTVNPTSPTTICNNPITLSVADSYASYYWSDGSANSTLEVSAPGTYTLNVQQQQGGNLCPGSATFTITPTGPTATLSGGTTLCNSSQTTPLSVALTGSAPWTLTYAIDGVDQAPVTGIASSPYVFQANGPHVYTLVSVADNSGCNSSASGSATVDLFPGIPVGHDDFFTAPGTADLSVDNDGGTYNWYDAPTGGNLVFTGDAYTTPVLNATTTYYVENTSITGTTSETVALPVTTSGPTGTNPDDLWMNFTANSDFNLDEITCAFIIKSPFNDTRLTLTIEDLTTSNITVAADILYTAADGLTSSATPQTIVVPLNYAVTSGHSYKISYRGRLVSDPNQQGALEGVVFWNYATGVNAYPITKDPELTLTRNAPQAEAYPGLFDWKISVPSASSSCGRTPVTAYTCPTAALSGDAVICNDGSTTPLTVDLSGRAPFSLTYTIDGIAQPVISNITASPYTFPSLPGAHTYALQSVANDDCSGTVSGTATVTLSSQSPIGHDTVFSAPGTALLRVETTGDTFEWYDASTSGNLVHTGDTLITPVLNGTTTYYVNNASITTVTTKSVALANTNDPLTTGNTTNAVNLPKEDCFLDFTANSNFTFDTVYCQVNVPSGFTGTGRIAVYLTPYAGALGSFTIGSAETLIKDSINIPVTSSGIQFIKIPLNYNCTAGTNYHISYSSLGNNTTQTIMYWNLMPDPSPGYYTITRDAEVTITQQSPQRSRYPGLFNWRISTISTAPTCGRTPVTAYVCPGAVLSGDAVICDDGTSTTDLTVTLSGDAPWSLTYAIDGVTQTAITGISTSPYTITSSTGAHVYTLIDVSSTHSGGCANGTSGAATVTVNPDAPTGHDAYFLPGDAANLSVDNTGGTYHWFASATDQTILQTSDTYAPVLTATTTFYVQQVVNGDTSCTRTPVTAYLCPTAVLSGDAVICNDGASTTGLTVDLSGDAPWSLTYAIDGVTQTAITGIAASPYTITSATGAHVYSLVSVSNATSSGCSGGTSGTATVTLKPDAPAGLDGNFTVPGTATLGVVETPGHTYSWYTTATGGISIANGSTFTTPTLSSTTVYYVEQISGNDTSCSRTPVTAQAFQPTEPLFIPNLMTPNNDGKNDQFEIKGLPSGSQLSIYNRWGNAVYRSDNYDNRWSAENMSAGVYFYELKLKNGESYKGWLQIIW